MQWKVIHYNYILANIAVWHIILSFSYGLMHFPLGVFRSARRFFFPQYLDPRYKSEYYSKMVMEKTKKMIEMNSYPFLALFIYQIALSLLQRLGHSIAPDVLPENYFLTFHVPIIFTLERVVRWANIFLLNDIGRQSIGIKRNRAFLHRCSDTLWSLIHGFIYETMTTIFTNVIDLFYPTVSIWFSFISCSLSNGMFAFDFKYTNKAVPFSERLEITLTNWPYFVGYGFYSTLPNLMDDRVLRTLFYIVLYHLSIVSCNEVMVKQYKHIPSAPNMMLSASIYDHCAESLAPTQESLEQRHIERREAMRERFNEDVFTPVDFKKE